MLNFGMCVSKQLVPHCHCHPTIHMFFKIPVDLGSHFFTQNAEAFWGVHPWGSPVAIMAQCLVMVTRTLAVEEWRTAPANCLFGTGSEGWDFREKMRGTTRAFNSFSEEWQKADTSKIFYNWLSENSPSNPYQEANRWMVVVHVVEATLNAWLGSTSPSHYVLRFSWQRKYVGQISMCFPFALQHIEMEMMYIQYIYIYVNYMIYNIYIYTIYNIYYNIYIYYI